MFESFSASGFFVHTPCGPRKSGTPDSVEIPAPVSATTRDAASIQPRTTSTSDVVSVRPILPILPFLPFLPVLPLLLAVAGLRLLQISVHVAMHRVPL